MARGLEGVMYEEDHDVALKLNRKGQKLRGARVDKDTWMVRQYSVIDNPTLII